MTKKMVWVTATFDALHHWPSAPDVASFLRQLHRHLFHVKVYCKVEGTDREIEFLAFKHRLNAFLKTNFEGTSSTASCEDFAMTILGWFPEAHIVEVSEDGENGATVERG